MSLAGSTAAGSGVGRHVLDHGVRVAADGVQIGVRIVLRDAPDAVAFVPERRPGQVLGQERLKDK
jgi:hypothetical protein